MAIFFVATFLIGSNKSHFSPHWCKKYPDEMLSSFERRVVWLLLPNIIINYFKAYLGVRWMSQKFGRPQFQSYYTLSCSFYCSYVLQGSYLIIFDVIANNVFSIWVDSIQIFLVACCLPWGIVLRLNMVFLDRQNFAMNIIRKEALKRRHSGANITLPHFESNS